MDLSIEPGEIVFLIGPSGSGKSTLAALYQWLETIQSGELIVDGLAQRVRAAEIRKSDWKPAWCSAV